jgi:hypothetical protein
VEKLEELVAALSFFVIELDELVIISLLVPVEVIVLPLYPVEETDAVGVTVFSLYPVEDIDT